MNFLNLMFRLGVYEIDLELKIGKVSFVMR